MAWRFTDQVQIYAARTWELLSSRPAENTVALTVIENVRAGAHSSAEPMLFGWYEAGPEVTGAVSMTPPYELHLAAVPPRAIDDLVTGLLARDVAVPGVNGAARTADTFSTAWTARVPVQATTSMRQRLYRLDTLRAASRPATGRGRRALPSDLPVAVDWCTRFQSEVAAPVTDVESTVRDRVEHGLLWLWADAEGHVVSLAGRHRAAAGVARVGPVYTPPEHRRHGYAAAVTAACTSDALARGARDVVLFTDLANPTSNAIYQQIGFGPVRDHHLVRFVAESAR